MRRLLLALLLCFSSLPLSYAAIANVQCVKGTWSSGTSYTASITATTGNLLVGSIQFWAGNSSNDFTAFGDGGTNTYTTIDSVPQVVGGLNTHLTTFYAKNITGGALTFTVTLSTNNVLNSDVVLCEVSGANTAAPLDVHAVNHQATPGTTTDAITSTSVTTTAAGEYIYGAVQTLTGNGNPVAGTGYTSNFVAAYFASEREIQGSAGSIAATFTESVNHDTEAAIATFKAAASGAPVGQFPRVSRKVR